MPPRPSEVLTEREAQIMRIVWERRTGTAEEVRRALPDRPHDSTVRTILRILENKGYLRHTRQGRTFVYAPLVGRGQAERTAVRTLLKRFFGGSAEALVQCLIGDEQLTPEQLEELRRTRPARRMGAKRRKGRRTGG